MMKRIIYQKHKAFIFMCLISIAGLFSITSCESEDELNTNQMGSSKITLKAYGPTPALRGGELRFIGNNVDKVTAVLLPGAGEVSTFTVKEKTEIRITVPQNAEEGYPVLVTPEGNITAVSLLTFEEPISISSITTAEVKAGGKFVIEGDYLNLVKEVVFQQNVVVEEASFISRSRAKIEVYVPAEASSGKIKVSNGAEIPIEVYSEDAAIITAPAIAAVAPLSVKAGTDITITGSNLDLAATLVFGGGKEVTDFTVSEDFKQITATVPADAQDGAITLIAKSSLEYVSADELTLVVPTELTASPATGIRPGNVITITGSDLDLVTSLLFPGMSETTAPASIGTTQLTVALPDAAQSGELTLNLASGKTVTVDIETKKPAVTAYNPASVTAGGALTVQGTDLDLVASITFGGDVTTEVLLPTATEFRVTVPVDAISGEPTLTMKNGETVTVSPVEITLPAFCFIAELPSGDEEILSGTIFPVSVVNGDKLTGVEVGGVTTQYILDGSQLNILVPKNCNGATEFKLISSNGEVTYTIDIVFGGKEYIWQGEVGPIGWSVELGGITFTSEMLAKLAVGKTFGIEFETVKDTWGWEAQVMGSWWHWLPTAQSDPRYSADRSAIVFGVNDTNFEFVLAQGDIDILTNQSLLLCGNGLIIKALYIY